MSPRKKMDDLENGTNTTDKYSDEKSYLENLRIDLLFFNILKLKVIEDNKNFINIKKFVTQEDLHSLECSIDYVEKRIFINIDHGYIDIKTFDENEMQDEKKYQEFLKKCRVQSIKPDKIVKIEKNKKIINKEIYQKYFLEIKINDKGMARIDEINDEIKRIIKQNSRVYQNLEKIKSFSDIMGNYKTMVGGIIILSLAFGILIMSPAQKYLANLPFLGSIIQQDIRDQFTELNLHQEGNEEMKSILVTFTHAIEKIYINDSIQEMPMYMIKFSDGNEQYFTVIQNKINFLTHKEVEEFLRN